MQQQAIETGPIRTDCNNLRITDPFYKKLRSLQIGKSNELHETVSEDVDRFKTEFDLGMIMPEIHHIFEYFMSLKEYSFELWILFKIGDIVKHSDQNGDIVIELAQK